MRVRAWLWLLLALGVTLAWAPGCSLGHNPDLPDLVDSAAGDGDGDGEFTSGETGETSDDTGPFGGSGGDGGDGAGAGSAGLGGAP